MTEELVFFSSTSTEELVSSAQNSKQHPIKRIAKQPIIIFLANKIVALKLQGA